MPTYNLPQAKTAAGTFSVSLISDIADLVVPPVNTIKSLDDANESLDFLPGLVMPGSNTMTLREYFSNHPEGFWHKAFSGSVAEIIVNIDEGGVVSNYFRGTLYRKATRWTENSLTGIKSMTGKVTFTNSLYVLKDVLTSTVLTEAKLHQVVNNNVIYLNVKDLFASIYKVGLNTASFDSNDINIIATDVEYRVVGADRPLSGVYLRIGSNGQYNGYFDSNSDRAWEVRFIDAYSLLGMLTKNFLVIPRYHYDTGTGRHKLELLSRGRNGLPITISGRVKASQDIPESESKISGIRVTNTWAPSAVGGTAWIWKGQEGKLSPPSTPPLEAKFDIDYGLEFLLSDDKSGFEGYENNFYQIIHAIDSSGNYVMVSEVRYWNYESNGWAFGDLWDRHSPWFHSRYLWKRFKVLGQSYDRTYKGIYATGGTTSQKELAIGRSILINGVTYYANEIRKRGSANEVSVNWIRE